MARPNLSVKTMSLVDSRWSFAVSHWLAGVRVCRAINDHRPRTVQEGTGGRENPGGCFLSNGFSRSREAQPFPPAPSGLVLFADCAESSAQSRQRKTVPRRPSQAIPE